MIITKILTNSREGTVEALKFGLVRQMRYMFVIWDEWEEFFYVTYTKENNVMSTKDRFDNNKLFHIMELYDLKTDLETQLDAKRAFCLPTPLFQFETNHD